MYRELSCYCRDSFGGLVEDHVWGGCENAACWNRVKPRNGSTLMAITGVLRLGLTSAPDGRMPHEYTCFRVKEAGSSAIGGREQ